MGEFGPQRGQEVVLLQDPTLAFARERVAKPQRGLVGERVHHSLIPLRADRGHEHRRAEQLGAGPERDQQQRISGSRQRSTGTTGQAALEFGFDVGEQLACVMVIETDEHGAAPGPGFGTAPQHGRARAKEVQTATADRAQGLVDAQPLRERAQELPQRLLFAEPPHALRLHPRDLHRQGGMGAEHGQDPKLVFGEHATVQTAERYHAEDRCLADHRHDQHRLGLEIEARDGLEVGVAADIVDLATHPGGDHRAPHTDPLAGPVVAKRLRVGIAHDARNELVRPVLHRVDQAGVVRDQALELIGDGLKHRRLVGLSEAVPERFEDHLELVDEFGRIVLGAQGVLQHLEVVDRCRGLVGDHLGERVHRADARLVLIEWHHSDVAQRLDVVARLHADLLGGPGEAVGIGRSDEDLAAQEVTEHLALGGDRNRAVE